MFKPYVAPKDRDKSKVTYTEVTNEDDLRICKHCGEWTNSVTVITAYEGEPVDEEYIDSACCG